MENVRKHRNLKPVTTEQRKNYLSPEPNYHATKFFTESSLVIEMIKTQTFLNKIVYLGLSILDMSKTATYKFWRKYKISLYRYRQLHFSCRNRRYL